MPAELKQTDEGTFQIVEEGQDPKAVKPEELLEAYQKAGADLTAQTVEVTVDGSKRTVTVGEAIQAFEKVSGADEKFQTAASKERAASGALELQQILTKMNTDPQNVTDAEFKKTLTLVGVPGEQIEQAMGAFQAIQSGQLPGGNTVVPQGDGDDQPIPFERLPKEVQESVKATGEVQKTLKTQQDQQFVEELRKNLQGALTSNEYLATILKAESKGKPVDWEAESSWAQDLFEEAWDKVLSKVGVQQQEPTPELLQGIAQEVRNRLERRFGKAGPGPEQDDNTSLGPATVLPPSVTPQEPPKRVSVGEPGRSGNIAKRLMALVTSAAKGGSGK